jgi:hypothetical protein
VERKLFYVEPDPEVMQQAEKTAAPNFLQAVLAALIGIPGYESIAEDLRLLTDRNSKLQQYHRLVREFQPGPVGGETRKLYDRSRLVSLSDRVVSGLFRKDGRTQQIPPEYQARAACLVCAFDNLPLDCERVLRDFDIEFRLRRIFRIVYLIYELLYGDTAQREEAPDRERARRYRALWQALNRQIKLCEILLWAMESLVDEADIPWQTIEEGQEGRIWAIIQGGFYRLLDDEGPAAQRIQTADLEAFLQDPTKSWMERDQLTAIQAELKDVAKKIVDEVVTHRFDPDKSNPHSLLGRVDACEQRLLEHFVPDPDDPVRQAFDHFKELDAHLFPLELVGNLHEKDVIATIRISPRDAKRGFSSIDLPSKVAGDAVFHFGGFFKRSWRSNDILWGRLDGLCQLSETLLNHDRISSLMTSPGWRQRIRDRFLDGDRWREELDPAILFPHAGAPTQEACRRWLSQLLGADAKAREDALEPKRFDAMVTLLVEAAQLEVLGEDLPNVMQDAVREQVEWNRFKVARGRKEEASGSAQPPWFFVAGKGLLDPLMTTAEAAVRARDAMTTLTANTRTPSRPTETGLGVFFKESYRVGSEKLLRDIPTIVLLEILAKALLVARTCILGLFGKEQKRIRQNMTFRLFIDWPLRAFYGLVRLSRRSPGLGLGVLLGLAVLSLFALSVGVLWWPTLVRPGHEWSRSGAAVFILAPTLILLLEMAFFALVSAGAEPKEVE